MEVYKEWKASGRGRQYFLEMAAEIEGIYVPSFYDVTYHEDGTIASFVPNNVHAKEKIKRQVVSDMAETTYPLSLIHIYSAGTAGTWRDVPGPDYEEVLSYLGKR